MSAEIQFPAGGAASHRLAPGMRTFLIIWIGELISMIGSGLTSFGLGVWIFQQTGKATPLALTALAYNLPRVLLSPLAGSIADRKNRRWVMILADSGAALVTLGIAALFFTGNLQVWHIYVSAALSSICGAFQDPAFRASITMLVPKKDLARAAGIQQIGSAVEAIVIPVLAGILYVIIGMRGIILIDFLTFFFAIGALAIVYIPQPAMTSDVAEGEGGKRAHPYWRDAAFGWKYLRQRPGLFGLLWYYAVINFFLNLSGVLSMPLVLSFGSAAEMGVVQTMGGIAMLLSGILISAWGGPKTRRIWWVIGAISLNGFGYFMAGLRPSTPLIAAGYFVILFFIPVAASLSQAVWQTKVAPDVQGRVFAIRGMIAYSIMPVSSLLAGPLADKVFEPLMAEGGWLSSTLIGSTIGIGPGRGVALIFIVSALALWATSLYAFSNRSIRDVEEMVPDAIPDEPQIAPETIPESPDPQHVDQNAPAPTGAIADGPAYDA